MSWQRRRNCWTMTFPILVPDEHSMSLVNGEKISGPWVWWESRGGSLLLCHRSQEDYLRSKEGRRRSRQLVSQDIRLKYLSGEEEQDERKFNQIGTRSWEQKVRGIRWGMLVGHVFTHSTQSYGTSSPCCILLHVPGDMVKRKKEIPAIGHILAGGRQSINKIIKLYNMI